MPKGRLLEITRRPNGVPSELLEGVLSALPHTRTFDLEKQCAAPLGASVHGPSGLIWRECTQRNQESNDVLPLSLGCLNHRHHRAQTPAPRLVCGCQMSLSARSPSNEQPARQGYLSAAHQDGPEKLATPWSIGECGLVASSPSRNPMARFPDAAVRREAMPLCDLFSARIPISNGDTKSNNVSSKPSHRQRIAAMRLLSRRSLSANPSPCVSDAGTQRCLIFVA